MGMLDERQSKQFSRLAALAKAMGCDPRLVSRQRNLTGSARVYVAGFGSIGRPMCHTLARFGLKHFVLADPKHYYERSIASQCAAADVGRLKVEVGAERLAGGGAEVEAFPTDLATLPDGLLDPNTILVVSADNRRADLLANRLAMRMSARLLKANIEPRYHFISIRCYDYRHDVGVCAECQMSDAARMTQRHPRSCDGSGQRRTAAPRVLSRAAGKAAALAVLQLLDDTTAQQWFSRQWQLALADGRAAWSDLTPSPACHCNHQARWPNLERLSQGPESLTLRDLLRHSASGASAEIRLCQQITTAACCGRCQSRRSTVRWISEVAEPVGHCECGGTLLPIPYFTYRQIDARQLEPVSDRPLAAWGVPPHAVFELAGRGRRRSFVVGSHAGGNSTGPLSQGAFL